MPVFKRFQPHTGLTAEQKLAAQASANAAGISLARWTRENCPGHYTWHYRAVVQLPSGVRTRIAGKAPINTKLAALAAERAHVDRLLNPAPPAPPEVATLPTFAEWFNGRFWREHVIAEGNRIGTQGEKRSVYENHLRAPLGHLRLDQIDRGVIQEFKAQLAGTKGRTGKLLSPKTRANILAVLSKALRYAEECELLDDAPRVKLPTLERPEIETLEIDEFGRLVVAARTEGHAWQVAVLLAGEAGLRIGEILALEWRHIDLIAGTITIEQQIRRGKLGPPKGGKVRKVPASPRLLLALRTGPAIRTGGVLRLASGDLITEGLAKHQVYRLCRLAGLAERSWHAFRHSFATHSAACGVNPWTLQRWMGHRRIDETMRYVHHVESHHRPLLPTMVAAKLADHADPDQCVLAMLSARVTDGGRGTSVAPAENRSTEKRETPGFPRASRVAGAGFELGSSQFTKVSNSNE